MSTEVWLESLDTPGALPALPEALIRIHARLASLDVDVDSLCSELERDPALTAEILKTINSPLFGMPRRIASLKQAVVLLGLRRVRAIILSQSLRRSLATYTSPGFEAFNWWDRSILIAVAAALVCQQHAPGQVEEAYLTGLLSEIGVLVMARFEPEYERLLRQFATAPCLDLFVAEQERFGYTHAQVAAGVLSRWKLPDVVVRAALEHHLPGAIEQAVTPLLPGMVFFAALVSDCIVSQRQDLCAQLTQIARTTFGMEPPDLFEFVSQCLLRYRALAREFRLPALLDPPVPESLARPA
ncbi:MAG: hypothetical protein BIFFINMI_03920 [Phycisphaerae bacterium]|nr:hypothetical protein [Phycisphaerae bacterium]